MNKRTIWGKHPIKNALKIDPSFQIRMEFSLLPSNMKGVKQLAIIIWGYCFMYCPMFDPVKDSLQALIKKETKLGNKYISNLYSG